MHQALLQGLKNRFSKRIYQSFQISAGPPRQHSFRGSLGILKIRCSRHSVDFSAEKVAE